MCTYTGTRAFMRTLRKPRTSKHTHTHVSKMQLNMHTHYVKKNNIEQTHTRSYVSKQLKHVHTKMFQTFVDDMHKITHIQAHIKHRHIACALHIYIYIIEKSQ